MLRPRVALYSHDAMGLGHMRRNLLLANALRRFPLRADVLLISGARELNAFPLPGGVDCVTLPGFSKLWDTMYVPRRLRMDADALLHLRARLILTALDEFEPDLLIVDKHARGLLNELEPALEVLASRGRTRIVLGLRDVLDDPEVARREWAGARNDDAIRDFYDAVWIYGDPAIYNALREYGFAPDIAACVRFTGYLDPAKRFRYGGARGDPLALLQLPGNPVILCQVGGGQDGGSIAEAFVRTALPAGATGVVVTGPFMPLELRERIQGMAAGRAHLRVIDFISEPELLLARAARVVTMGGYNSVTEVLAAEKRALIIPRTAPRSEQLIRAQRLHELGVARMLHPLDATPEALEEWVSSEPSAPVRIRDVIDFHGLDRLPRLVEEVLSVRPPRAPAPLAA